MSLSLLPQIGAVAGWKLELTGVKPRKPGQTGPLELPEVRGDTMAFSSEDYRGRVDANLVSGLSPGSYTVVIEGVSEAEFKRLAAAAHGEESLLEARLFLYWLDAPLPSLAESGLVAVLRVSALRRRAGKWRYELVVEGREWVYDRLLQPCPKLTGNGPLDTARQIARALGVKLGAAPPGSEPSEPRTTNPGARAIDELRELERALVKQAARARKHRAGLGMYLIRDGELQLGPDRLQVPLQIPTLAPEQGLLALERNGVVGEDERALGPDDGQPPRRDLFIATLRGRPDLKPGDIVQFAAPEQDGIGSELGFALGPGPQLGAGENVTAYIQEVNHRLSREQGFVSVVRCVAAATDRARALVERLWFKGAASDSAASAGSGESALARAFDRVRDAARSDRWPDVAQVRAHYVDGEQQPLQTQKLWRGLDDDDDGLPFAATRHPFARDAKALSAAPYATPFAFGKCGLIVPRYPGTRVLVVNRGGDPDDPIDVGALWQREQAPDQAQIGDWWLITPVDLDGEGAPRGAIDDADPAEPQPSLAAQDLIDAHGNRVIEVGKLTIRIGKEQLRAAGERPPLADDPVTIEHDGGKARILIAQDGAITIESTKTLTLKGDQGIALHTSGDVSVHVGGLLDVKKGA